MTPGYILAGKYRLITLLGRGGMGAVWCAERLEWGSLVAVKLMERANEARPDVLARFLQEARLAANLRSSHVVQVLDDGRDAATGTPFIVMELLVGETLAQRLARRERLTPSETSRIVTHVARALALAHELGMVHRDLKPDNIFLVRNDDEETAKVLDFGIAKWNVESWLADAATTTGTAIGTPSYMSPEQIKDSKRVDHRTDLWSLALIASECLTGRRAFEADNLLSLALSICNELPPAPSSLGAVPAGVDAWFERATARELSRRFSSARELAETFRSVCGVASVAAERSEPVHSLPPSGSLVFERTEILGGPPDPHSTEGLTRTAGAVAAFRTGRRRTRALVFIAAALGLAGAGAAVRSELAPRAAARGGGPGRTEQAAELALRTAPRGSEARLGAALTALPAPSGALPGADSERPPSAGAERGGARPQPFSVSSSPALLGSPGAPPPRAAGIAVPPARIAASGAVGSVAAARSPSTASGAALAPVAAGDAAGSEVTTDGMAATGEAAPEAAPTPSALVAEPPAPGPPENGAPALAPDAVLSAALPPQASPAPAPSAEPFDPDAARAALEDAASRAQSCRPPGGPHGRGRVQVRFEPSGKVGAAWLMTPLFDNTVTGSCVLMLFRRATIPPFGGEPQLVIKSFDVP